MNPALSIIIPVYKAEAYLGECLDTVLASTFPDYELLLVDDGSPDMSGTICDEYARKEPRIKVIHKQNGGASSARNVGIESASAPWITFIDADDFIDTTFIERLYDAVIAHPETDFVQAGCQIFLDGKVKGIEYKYQNFVGVDKGYLFREFRGLTVSKLFKRSILNKAEGKIRFDEKLRSQEDMIFTLDYVYHVSKYVFLDQYGYYYRVDNSSSISHTTCRLCYQDIHHSFSHHFDSVYRVITDFGISEQDSIRRKYQVADSMEFSIYSLFTSKQFTFLERIDRLKRDYTKEQLEYLQFCKGKSNRILFFFLSKRQYFLFNLLTTLKLSL